MEGETMNRSKHAPGPWRATKPGGAVFDAKERIVAQVVRRPTVVPSPHEERVANARLIAAAPDLLNACGMAQRLIEDMARVVGKRALRDYAFFNDALIALRKAVDKAFGQEAS
jgi:hypothetical protein